MVKADASKDYYAALEISPNCGASEIKKQFHKLALLYHPDRNPGKEREFNPRFQAIQEAHEVLSDDEQRAKYDVARKRVLANSFNSSNFARPAAPRRNNPYHATSNFPPPPSRTRPRTEVPPPTAKTNADRYAQWNAPPQPPPRQAEKTSAGQDARDRANMFTAWQHMNRSQRAAPPGSKYNVAPPYQGQQRPVPTPPGTPASRPSGRHRATTSISPTRVADGGNVNPGLSRTTSSRVPPRRSGFDQNSPAADIDESRAPGPFFYRPGPQPQDQPGRNPMPARVPSEPNGSYAVPPQRRPDGLDNFRPHSSEDVPFAEGTPKEKTPYPKNVGERTTYFDSASLRRTSSVQDTAAYFASNMPQERRRSEAGPSIPPPRPFVVIHSDDEDDDSSEAENTSHVPGEHKPGHRPSVGSTGSSGSFRAQNPTGGPPRAGGTVRFQVPSHRESMARSSNPEMNPRRKEPLKSSSMDQAQGYASDSTTHSQRPASNPNMFQFGAQQQQSSSEDDVSPMPKPKSAGDDPVTSPGAGMFAADQWKKDLQEDNWASRWANPTDTSSPKTSAAGAKSKGLSSRAPTRNHSSAPVTPPSHFVGDVEAGWFAPNAGGPVRNFHDDIDPMDVDSEPPANIWRPSTGTENGSGAPQGPRQVHVEPSRPEWRDHDRSTDYNRDRQRDSTRSQPTGDAQEGSVGPPSSSMRAAPAVQPPGQINMQSFRHVAPFQTAQAGDNHNAALQNLKADLATELPFPSQASTSLLAKDEVQTPALPKVPRIPVTPSPLTRVTWDAYLGGFYIYVSQWSEFYLAMMAVFRSLATAQAQFTSENSPSPTNPQSQTPAVPALTAPAPGIMPFWASTKGEAQGLKGWASYMTVANEEARLRKYLDVASERHLAAVEAHDRLRQRVEKESKNW